MEAQGRLSEFVTSTVLGWGGCDGGGSQDQRCGHGIDRGHQDFLPQTLSP